MIQTTNNSKQASKALRTRSSGKQSLHQDIDKYPCNPAVVHKTTALLDYCN